MNIVKYLPHPGIIAVLVIAMMVLEPLMPKFLVSWISFQTWALYFIAGGTPKQGFKAGACYIGGVLAAILIMVLANATGATLGKATLPVVCAAVAFAVICFEKVKLLDFIPAWFIGAGAFFALANVQGPKFQYGPATVTVISAMVIGMLWGFMTVLLRTKYGAWAEKAVVPVPTADR
jgi:hypothetical protein